MILLTIVTFLISITYTIVLERRRRSKHQSDQLPPGPRWWQVMAKAHRVGNSLPHLMFAQLADEYGQIMTVQMGSMVNIVISSSDVAKAMFKDYDVQLAGRRVLEALNGPFGTEGSIVTSNYGRHWRILRRMFTAEFTVTSRLNAMRDARQRCVDSMVKFIGEEARSHGGPIDLGRFFSIMTFNQIGYLIFSKELIDPKSERGAEFFDINSKVMELLSRPNIADFFPIFKALDAQGLKKRTQIYLDRALEIIGAFIQERLEQGRENQRKDYLDLLLENHGDSGEKFSSRTINVIILEMFMAGNDTMKSTLEWAMAEILHNPRIMEKVQDELRSNIPAWRNLLEEEVENLPYLGAVLKETLRLHPPLPLLVPHMARESCKMLGYNIPKDTQILVNFWAIGRDPSMWEDPTLFRPERFLEPKRVGLDYKGQHYELLPFGTGRRMCPAMPLASRVMKLALGSILHSFDWALPDGLGPQEMDMTEEMVFTLRRVLPLKVIPTPYSIASRHDSNKKLTFRLPTL